MSYSLDETRRILKSDNVRDLSRELHRQPWELYLVRAHFRRFIGKTVGPPQASLVPLFEQLKAEGIEDVAETPTSSISRSAGRKSAWSRETRKEELSPAGIPQKEQLPVDQSRRDPIAEMEIAFDSFKEKLNELIPLVVEEQVKEAIFRASIKGNTRRRILR